MVTEKKEFQNGGVSIKYHYLQSSDNWDPDSMTRIKKYSIESSSATVELSTVSLMKDIKPLVIDKPEFNYRDESVMIVLLRLFGQSRF